MKIVTETIAALGAPLWMESLERSYGQGALIARWRHGDARVAVSAADAIRVVLSLSATQRVRHAEGGPALTGRGLPGQVSVFRAGAPSETTIEGEADVVQIFIAPDSLLPLGQTPAATPSVSQDELELAVIQLLVAARFEDPRRDAAEVRLGRIVHEWLASPLGDENRVASGGLPPFAVRRVEQRIGEAINRSGSASPDLEELAATAGLSVNHFIRAFRKTIGTTPHRLVMKRRTERAIELLAQPDLTVADVSDAAGYSSPAHFVASFRRRLGVTPGSYRRAILGSAIRSLSGKG